MKWLLIFSTLICQPVQICFTKGLQKASYLSQVQTDLTESPFIKGTLTSQYVPGDAKQSLLMIAGRLRGTQAARIPICFHVLVEMKPKCLSCQDAAHTQK